MKERGTREGGGGGQETGRGKGRRQEKTGKEMHLVLSRSYVDKQNKTKKTRVGV